MYYKMYIKLKPFTKFQSRTHGNNKNNDNLYGCVFVLDFDFDRTLKGKHPSMCSPCQ